MRSRWKVIFAACPVFWLAVLLSEGAYAQTLLDLENGRGHSHAPLNEFFVGISFGENWIFGDAEVGSWNVSSWDCSANQDTGLQWGSADYWMCDFAFALVRPGNRGRIEFDNADATFAQVAYCYGNNGVLNLEAYDTSGALIDSDTGVGNSRVFHGNENGPGYLRVDAPMGSSIAAIEIFDSENFYLIDNLLTDATGISTRQPLSITSRPFSAMPMISVSPADQQGRGDGVTPFTRLFDPGANVSLTAPETVGDFRFEAWLRNGEIFSGNLSVSIDDFVNDNMTAVYMATADLSVASSNPNAGVSIIIDPPDTNMEAVGDTPFSRTYTEDTMVTLTAPAEADGNVFQEWQLNSNFLSATPVITVAADEDKALTAIYSTAVRQVSVSSTISGIFVDVAPPDNNSQAGGNPPFVLFYDDGSNVTFIAGPPPIGTAFVEWRKNEIAVAFDPEFQLTVDDDLDLTAVYVSTDVFINLLPQSSSVVAGGALDFDVILTNTTAVQQVVDVWIDAFLPSGAPYARNPVIGPQVANMGPGRDVRRSVSLNVPETLPPSGPYTLMASVGVFPSFASDTAAFEFSVDLPSCTGRSGVVSGPSCVGVGYSVQYQASGFPSGGTYSWTISSGASRASIVGSTSMSVVEVRGDSRSAVAQDVELTVVYNGPQCSNPVTNRLTVVDVTLEFRDQGVASTDNNKRSSFPSFGLPQLGPVSPGNPAGTGGFFKSIEIKATIEPCVAGLGCTFDFKRTRQGRAGVLSPGGTFFASPGDCPAPQECDDDPPPDSDEDLVLDAPPSCTVFVLDAPGFFPGVCGLANSQYVTINCMNFKEWLTIDGFRASSDLNWYASSRIQCLVGAWFLDNGGSGNVVGQGQLQCLTSFRGADEESMRVLDVSIEEVASLLGSPDVAERLAGYEFARMWIKGGNMRGPTRTDFVGVLRDLVLREGQPREMWSHDMLAIELLSELGVAEAVPLLVERIYVEYPRAIIGLSDGTVAGKALARIGHVSIDPILSLAIDADEEQWSVLRRTLVAIDDQQAVRQGIVRRLEVTREPVVRARLFGYLREHGGQGLN